MPFRGNVSTQAPNNALQPTALSGAQDRSDFGVVFPFYLRHTHRAAAELCRSAALGRSLNHFILSYFIFALLLLSLKHASLNLLASIAVNDYTTAMNFEWDEQKNQSNIRKHGFSFADAWEMFEAPMLIELDEREDYGEERWVGIGSIQTRTVVVIYTEPDDETIRIISLRKALKHERQAYGQYIKD